MSLASSSSTSSCDITANVNNPPRVFIHADGDKPHHREHLFLIDNQLHAAQTDSLEKRLKMLQMEDSQLESDSGETSDGSRGPFPRKRVAGKVPADFAPTETSVRSSRLGDQSWWVRFMCGLCGVCVYCRRMCNWMGRKYITMRRRRRAGESMGVGISTVDDHLYLQPYSLQNKQFVNDIKNSRQKSWLEDCCFLFKFAT